MDFVQRPKEQAVQAADISFLQCFAYSLRLD